MLRIASFAVLLLACSSDPVESFRDCVGVRADELGVARAIEVCCVDHVIEDSAPDTVCGSTSTSCIAYVTARVSTASSSEIATACASYAVDRM